jgi:hypothetical protein
LRAQALSVGPVAAPFSSHTSVRCSKAPRAPFQRNPTCWLLGPPQDCSSTGQEPPVSRSSSVRRALSENSAALD